MASNTDRLNLLKKNPVTDGADTFNIDEMLNDNWDKIDENVALVDPLTGKLLPGQENVADLTDYVKGAELTTELNKKVDKVAGKKLSTEDFTTEEKTKLSDIQAGSQANAVDSVNSKTGAVVLSAADVGAETPTGAQAKVDALGGVGNTKTVKQVSDDLTTHSAELTQHTESAEAHGIGKHANLKTTAKNTIVQAINELYDTKQKAIYIQATEPTSPKENDIWIEVEP